MLLIFSIFLKISIILISIQLLQPRNPCKNWELCTEVSLEVFNMKISMLKCKGWSSPSNCEKLFTRMLCSLVYMVELSPRTYYSALYNLSIAYWVCKFEKSTSFQSDWVQQGLDPGPSLKANYLSRGTEDNVELQDASFCSLSLLPSVLFNWNVSCKVWPLVENLIQFLFLVPVSWFVVILAVTFSITGGFIELNRVTSNLFYDTRP